MISFLKLIRYKNLLMVLLTMVLTKYALVEFYISSKQLSFITFFILTVSTLFIAAGGYIINDIYDLEADKINKPTRVFVGKTISKKNAWRSYFVLTIIGLILGFISSYFIGILSNTRFFILTVLILFLYSKYLKRFFLIGNISISFLVGLIIFLVYFFSIRYRIYGQDNIELGIYYHHKTQEIGIPILMYITFSFLTTLIREIIKDIEDVNGDLKINARTLPIVIGRKRANRVALGFSIVLLLFLIVIIREFLIEQPVFLVY